MPIVRLENAIASFSNVPLLDRINLQIDPNEKIFLVGRNGMGKSFLLKVIMGHHKLDDGNLYINPSAKITELPQDLPDCNNTTIYEYVANGLLGLGDLLSRYHELTSSENVVHDDVWMKEVEETQKQLELRNGWEYENTITTVLNRLNLPANSTIGSLSGGWKRRASLARAIVCKPDLLLLDEPTNHLDLDAIEWLENFLQEYTGAVLCITHDRSLLRKLSKRIIELDRGHITSWHGNYTSFLLNKEHRLEVEAKNAREFDKILAKEEAWIRKGIKARRTRNEGRVRALQKLRQEYSERRILQGSPKFKGNEDNASGNLVINAKNISFSYDDKCLINSFSSKIHRGDKIALVGPNGIGKSTLLKILLGRLDPQIGTVKLGTNLKISYFDQMRAGINPELSLIENVAGGKDTITINGKEKHIISYLSDFLFTPERARLPVRVLSGGECNRLLLAKLFSLPSNLLVLDEPTNDLDIESLDLLEEVLLDYKGTILIVSHDREFIDNVATNTFVFRGNGIIEKYVGSFSDIPKLETSNDIVNIGSDSIKTRLNQGNDSKAKSAFTSKMKKELRKITTKIERLEEKKNELHRIMADTKFYERSKNDQNITIEKESNIDKELATLYQKWEELEILREKSKN